MNGLERLRTELAKRFPAIKITVDRPDDPAGSWFLDVHRAKPLLPIVVEWREKHGFGVSTPTGDDSDYGSGPEEIYPTYRTAVERISELINTNGTTSPGGRMPLAQLRLRCGISQTELAERLGVTQAAIARMERRDDVLLSTVGKMARAMGVDLKIQAVLPNGETREIAV